MSDELEVMPPDSSFEDDDGGPVKSFLEHLEDLRWTLVKCAAAVFIGIIACLSGSDFIIGLLKWPLDKANGMRISDESQIALTLGTNVLAKFGAKEFPSFRPGGLSNNPALPAKTFTERVGDLFHSGATNQPPKSFGQRFGDLIHVEGSAANRDVFLRIEPVTIGTNTILAVVPDLNPPKAATDGMQTSLAVLSPGEAFTVAVQIAIYGGFTVSAPFVIFFLGQFILPALHVHEKKFLYQVSAFATGLFLAGVAFCYFVMMIITLSTTVGFANWLGFRSDLLAGLRVHQLHVLVSARHGYQF
jgi:sec-independent protein translocase protein TatC